MKSWIARFFLLSFITISWKVYSQQIHPIVAFHITYYDKQGYENTLVIPHEGYINRTDVFTQTIEVPTEGIWYWWVHSVDSNKNDSRGSKHYTVTTQDLIFPPENLRFL